MSRIYLSPPDVGLRERELLLEAFDSNWIAPYGPYLDEIEHRIAGFVGTSGAAALNSGTAALHLALLLAGVEPGDDVVVPTLTFVATANAASYVGARPVLIDCSPDTWTLDPELLAEELQERLAANIALPRAVVTVDLYGQCADYDAIEAICDEHEITLVEDAAEALGATYRGTQAGKFGQMAALSFNGNKTLTTSGGGMLVSDDLSLVEQARFLATQARDDAPHYEHSEIGYNYRLSNLLAALGCAQVETLQDKVGRRRAIKARYRGGLAGLDGIGFMPDAAYGEPSNWLTVITLDPEQTPLSPTELRIALEASDIEARPSWKPMHLQPIYKGAPMRGGSVTQQIFETGLCLPSGSSLTDADQDRVIAGICEAHEVAARGT